MYRLLFSLFVLFFVASCASIEKPVPDSIVEQPGNYKYPAWRIDAFTGNGAVTSLLNEVDMLIASEEFDAAADKLERILRINPQYAPAWSRLSWLALQTNSPQRSVQMAKRSNSFAFSDADLQWLNWSFIRDASKILHDEVSYNQARKKLDFLKPL